MSRSTRWLSVGLLLLALLLGAGCMRPTSHPVTPLAFGVAESSARLDALIDQPGPLQLETIKAADWSVARGGLLDLESPRSRALGLEPGDEPIVVQFHVLRHPERGTWLIDSGVERRFVHAPSQALLRGLIGRMAGVDRMIVHTDTASWLATQPSPLAGVLLTHLHLDHLLGLPDLPASVPVYLGPGETESRSAQHLFTQSIVNEALRGKQVYALSFRPDPQGLFEGVLDLFGDGSLWALLLPGHTRGSLAFVARTTEGAVLFTGDVSHTAIGWRHGIAPGSFSEDHAQSTRSFSRLRAWARRHPTLRVVVGHQ